MLATKGLPIIFGISTDYYWRPYDHNDIDAVCCKYLVLLAAPQPAPNASTQVIFTPQQQRASSRTLVVVVGGPGRWHELCGSPRMQPG